MIHGAFFDNGVIKFIHNVKSFTDNFFFFKAAKYKSQKEPHATTIKEEKGEGPCLNRKLTQCFYNLEYKH